MTHFLRAPLKNGAIFLEGKVKAERNVKLDVVTNFRLDAISLEVKGNLS